MNREDAATIGVVARLDGKKVFWYDYCPYQSSPCKSQLDYYIYYGDGHWIAFLKPCKAHFEFYLTLGYRVYEPKNP